MTAPGSPPYDPKAAARALAGPERPSRKLTFYEQCGVFYALYNRIEHQVVAKAFGITTVTVSYIGGCLDQDPRPHRYELARTLDGGFYGKAIPRDMNRNRSPNRIRRYGRVADEFRRLGEETFAEKYFPQSLADRLRDIKLGHDQERARPHGSDPQLDGLSNDVDYGYGVMTVAWVLEPRPPAPIGWYIIGEHSDMGAEIVPPYSERGPFKNQKQARKAVWIMNGLDPP